MTNIVEAKRHAMDSIDEAALKLGLARNLLFNLSDMRDQHSIICRILVELSELREDIDRSR